MRELTQTIAKHLVVDMRAEAATMGLELSDYDIDSFCDNLDDVTHEITRHIETLLPNP